jgi:hypothetical protein
MNKRVEETSSDIKSQNFAFSVRDLGDVAQCAAMIWGVFIKFRGSSSLHWPRRGDKWRGSLKPSVANYPRKLDSSKVFFELGRKDGSIKVVAVEVAGSTRPTQPRFSSTKSHEIIEPISTCQKPVMLYPRGFRYRLSMLPP